MANIDHQNRPHPRKQPKQTRSRQTVEIIVEAAARILEQYGLDNFTTNAVAERAGVSIGSIYQYFPQKSALIGTLITRETSRLVKDAEAAIGQPSGISALVTVIRAAVAHQLRRPILARLLDFEEARLPFDADTLKTQRQFHTVLSNILSRPDLPSQTDFETTVADVAAILRGMVDAAGERGEKEQDALVRRVQRAVFGYLGISL